MRFIRYMIIHTPTAMNEWQLASYQLILDNINLYEERIETLRCHNSVYILFSIALYLAYTNDNHM